MRPGSLSEGKRETKRARKRGHEGRIIIRHIANGTMKDGTKRLEDIDEEKMRIYAHWSVWQYRIDLSGVKGEEE
jgi:hypothetical protein